MKEWKKGSKKEDLLALSKASNDDNEFGGVFLQTQEIDLEGSDSNQWESIAMTTSPSAHDQNNPDIVRTSGVHQFKGIYDGENSRKK